MPIFDINADIRRAETLASEFYTDAKYFEQSKEQIFARTWQFLNTVDDVSTEHIAPATMLENFLDEPVLLVRDEAAEIRCLSNVCTHRGNILIETPCAANAIRCRYHGRKFDLQGKFVSMPEFENVCDFPSEKDNLTQIPSAQWARMLFASVNPSAPFEDFFGAMQTRLEWLDWEKFRFNAALSTDYTVKAHWALYCENYLEGFHIPFVHQSLNNEVDYGSYSTELFRFSSLQTGFARNGENCFDLPADSPDCGAQIGAYYFWVFPNLMFNFYPWGLSVNIVKPQTPTLTQVSFLIFVVDESKLATGAGADLHSVELEDEAIVQNVQRGIRSRFYTRGRYSPSRETGTHHFHRLIAEMMNEQEEA